MIKTFENWNKKSTYDKPDFNVGDTVICIDEHPNGNLILNMRYKVDKIYYCEISFNWYCIVSGFNNESIDNPYYCTRFISEIDYQTNRYNL